MEKEVNVVSLLALEEQGHIEEMEALGLWKR